MSDIFLIIVSYLYIFLVLFFLISILSLPLVLFFFLIFSLIKYIVANSNYKKSPDEISKNRRNEALISFIIFLIAFLFILISYVLIAVLFGQDISFM